MPDFQASLLNPDGSLACVLSDTTIEITDTSNYATSTEVGAEQADFSFYRKISVEDANGVIFNFISIGGGDATIVSGDTAAANNPTIYDLINAVMVSGAVDGVYLIKLLTLPSFNGSKVYSNTSFVFNSADNLFYKSLQNTNIGHAPSLSPTWWAPVSEDEVSTRFFTYGKLVRTRDLEICKIKAVEVAACEVRACQSKKNICKNGDMQKAMKIQMLISAINQSAIMGEWDTVADLVSSGKSICGC